MVHFKVHSDDRAYSSNPLNIEFKELCERLLSNTSYFTSLELANHLKQGKTILPSVFDGVRNASHFIETSVIFVKFEVESSSFDSILNDVSSNHFVLNNASFIVYGFDSSSDFKSFTLGFVLDYPIKKMSQFKMVVSFLSNLFPDSSNDSLYCSFVGFGGQDIQEINFNNYLDWKSLFNPDFLPSEEKTTVVKKTKNMKDFYSNFNPQYNANQVTSLIISHDCEGYKNYLQNHTSINLKNDSEIVMKRDIVVFFNAIPTRELFGLYVDSPSSYFPCVLTEDNLNSARVFKEKNSNIYEYCIRIKDDYVKLTNFEVLANLLDTEDVDFLIDFITSCFDLEITVPEHLRIVKENVNKLENLFDNPEYMKATYPKFYKMLFKNKEFIVNYLKHLSQFPMIFNEDSLEKYQYFMAKSNSTIAKVIIGEENSSSFKKVTKSINILAYLGLVKKIPVVDYPKDIKIILLNIKRQLNVSKTNNVVLLTMNSDFENFMQVVENKCSFLYENGYSFQTFTKSFLNRIENETVSDEIYVQYEGNGEDDFGKVLATCKSILKSELCLSENIYVLDNFVKSKVEVYHSKLNMEKHYTSAIQKVLSLNEFSNLERKKASKYVKELLNLDENMSHNYYVIYKK